MGTPSSQTCASWVKEYLVSTEWCALYDCLVAVLSERLSGWPSDGIHDFVENNILYVAEHLRDEVAEWRLDGRSPRFEIDEEQSPYVRACSTDARPVLTALRRVDPFAFEGVCARILIELGADARVTQQSADGGIDFIATGLRIVPSTLGVPSACNAVLVGQAKRYKEGNNIRESQVREFVGAGILQLHRLQAEGKVGPLAPTLFAFWTTAEFDQGARRYARAAGVWYMDGDTLANYVHRLGLFPQLAT